MWVAKDKETGKYWKRPLWSSGTLFGTWVENRSAATPFITKESIEFAVVMEPESIEYVELT